MLPVYIDIDDVLCDTSQSFILLLEREFGKKVAFEDITSFDLKVSFGLTPAEYEHFFRTAHQSDQILNMDPIPEAVETLRRWVGSGLEIHIVTGRLTSTYDTTLEWLARHDVPYHKFLMVDKYARPDTDRAIAISKQELSHMKFHAAIEDSYEMALHIADKMATPVYLFDRPWNRVPGANRNIKRFHAWKNIRIV